MARWRRDDVLSLIDSEVARLRQTLDEAAEEKITQLNDQQLAALYEEFQDRVSNSRHSPIRNVSALIVHLARGLLSGRISSAPGRDASSGNAVPHSRHSSSEQAHHSRDGRDRPPLMDPRALIAKSSKQPKESDPDSVERLLEDYGISNVDGPAVQKLEELDRDDQVLILHDFVIADKEERIQNPSKWLYARARSMLVQHCKDGTGPSRAHLTPRDSHHGESRDMEEIPELPGVFVDKACADKMAELEPEERAELIQDFQAESAHVHIRNPSSFMFSNARARIVQRVTNRKAAHSVRVPRRRSGSEDREAEKATPLSFKELGEMGVDDQALRKLQELSSSDLRDLLLQFSQLYGSNQIDNPSKWLYSRARTIAARITQQQQQQQQYRDDRGRGGGGGGASTADTAAAILAALSNLDLRHGAFKPEALAAAAKIVEAASSQVAAAGRGGSRGSGSGLISRSRARSHRRREPERRESRHSDGHWRHEPERHGSRYSEHGHRQSESEWHSRHGGDRDRAVRGELDLRDYSSRGDRGRDGSNEHDRPLPRLSPRRGRSRSIGRERHHSDGSPRLNRSRSRRRRRDQEHDQEEFEGADLDAKAREKLQELEPQERSDLAAEYREEVSRKQIHNPSAWVFGRARTKIVDRITHRQGRNGDRRH